MQVEQEIYISYSTRVLKFYVGCKSSPSHILNKKESNGYENDEMGLH